MGERPRIPAQFPGLLAAALACGALHAVLWPASVGLAAWDYKYLAVVPAVLLPAALVGAAAFFIPALLRPRPAEGWRVGCAVGLTPLLVSWAFHLAGPARSAELPAWLLPLAAVAVFALLWRFLPPAPAALDRPALGWAVLTAGLLAWAATFVGVGVPTPEPYAPPSLPPAPEKLAAADRPNVILVSVDTLRADAVGDPKIETPGLDALYAAGRSADFALAPAPMTLPSHASMLSGWSPLKHGAINNKSLLPSELPNVAELFRENGWRTVAVVTNGLLEAENGFGKGFELYNLDLAQTAEVNLRPVVKKSLRWSSWPGFFLPQSGTDQFFELATRTRTKKHRAGKRTRSGEDTLETAEGYLQALAAGEAPYFFFLHFMDPHAPYAPHQSVSGTLTRGADLPERYRGWERAAPGNANEILEEDLAEGLPGAQAAVEHLRQLYLEEVLFIDRAIDRVREIARQSGRPTYLLFTSDHGEHFGEHGLMDHANSLYGELLRVPFVLEGPDVPAGTRFDRRPHLEDVPPTLLGLAGIDYGAGVFDGHDLSQGSELQPDGERYFAWWEKGFAVYDGEWKLLGKMRRTPEGFEGIEAATLLKDGGPLPESGNQLEQEPGRVEAMLAFARQQLGRVRVADDIQDPDRAALLEEMGYAGDDEDDGR